MTIATPLYLQGLAAGSSAKLDRHQLQQASGDAVGVIASDGYAVTSGGSGLQVSVAAGEAIVKGTTNTFQGSYRVVNDGAVTLTATTANGTNPRIDQIILQVQDNTEDASGQNQATLSILAGTATVGATLDNRTGAAALPASSILLADLLVPAAFAGPFVNATHIRSRRQFVVHNDIPQLITARKQVLMAPCLGTVSNPNNTTCRIASTHDLHQAAILCYLPARITGAIAIRWCYIQDSVTALTGTYNIGVYDSFANKLFETGAQSFTGVAGSLNEIGNTITPTPVSLEPGLYWVCIGVDTTNAGAAYMAGIQLDGNAVGVKGAALRATSGGTTMAQTLSALTDISDLAAGQVMVGVPLIAIATS